MRLPQPPPSLTWAKAKARAILSELDLRHPCDMDIEDIAWGARRILVKNEDLIGTEGRLVKLGDSGIISVRAGIPEAGRRRFIIAHEIGHFEMHKKDENQLDLCTQSDLEYEYHGSRPEEKEASAFATELLLPEEIFGPPARNAEIGFNLVRKLADEFDTTLTLTAMRMIQFTSYRAALVASENGKIKWVRASPTFGYQLPYRAPLDEGTIAADVHSTKEAPPKSQLVLAGSWIKNTSVDPDKAMREECLWLGRYGTALSLIWMEQDVEAD